MMSSLATFFLYPVKQTDSMLQCVCSVVDHRGRQNVIRTSVTHSPNGSCATFLFLTHLTSSTGDLLLNRRTATWKLFVKYMFLYNAYFIISAVIPQLG